MDSIESFVSELLTKILHQSAPAMSPDDDAKVTKAVQDFVTAAMDVAAVYFAIRKARTAKP